MNHKYLLTYLLHGAEYFLRSYPVYKKQINSGDEDSDQWITNTYLLTYSMEQSTSWEATRFTRKRLIHVMRIATNESQILTYLLTYLLHGAEYFLRSYPVYKKQINSGDEDSDQW